MPQLPQINAPESVGGARTNARANPVLLTPSLRSPVTQQAVRANPGMRDAEFAAGARVGGAIAEAGELGFRIKGATDAGYITRSQTQMEAVNIDFQNWTKTNPDPAGWDAELNERLSSVRDSVTEGAKQLSPLARKHLGIVLNSWDTGTRARVKLQATEQNLNIAQASYNEFIVQATAANDLPAIAQKTAEAVKTGIFAPQMGQIVMKRARVQIQQNMANGMIEADPFEAERQFQEKDTAGAHLAFPEMNDSVRQTLVFRAHKAAQQTRTNTMREWASLVADAQAGRGPMPDRESVDEEAKHQGIGPKWVANLFKVPTATDPDEFARTYSAISSYDHGQDPTGKHMGELVAQIEAFKGPAREHLDGLLTSKLKPDDTLNSPVAKFGVQSIKELFEIGGYGQFKEPAKLGPDGETRVPAHEVAASKQKAEVIQARNLDLFHDWLRKNPAATYEQAQKYINSLNAEHATNNASRLIINSGAFGFPVPKK